MTAGDAEQAPDSNESAQDAGDGAEDEAVPEDDVKRRFREALERKQAGDAGGGAHGAGGPQSKVHGSQAKAAARREFRRKSG